MKLTPEQRTAALATFSEYFVRNYPGPHTIIGDPTWHAPKVFRAALHAIEMESVDVPPGRCECDAVNPQAEPK